MEAEIPGAELCPERAEATQESAPRGMAGAIVHCRAIGLNGGQGCRLRYTPPDAPPSVGQVLNIRARRWRVVSVVGEAA